MKIHGSHRPLRPVPWLLLLSAGLLLHAGCRTSRSPNAEKTELPSMVTVSVNPGGPILIKTSAAQFEILASGYVRASLLKDGKPLSLDEPLEDSASSGDHVVSGGKEIGSFTLDFDNVKITEARGKLGARGKRVEIIGHSPAGQGAKIEQTFAAEVYDDFPDLLLTTVAYKNVGSTELSLDRIVTNRHRLNASLADSHVTPYDLWSFQGSSSEWGKPDVLEIPKGFNQPNLMGGPTPKGLGGGIPVVDFWTATVGEAIGHVETLPQVVSFPVKVEKDGRISTSMVLEPGISLKPGEEYSTPTGFVAVHSGDYYEALGLWSKALQKEGWTPAQPTDADYQVSWCSWGYEQDFTPAQMLGTIPKLKELGIKWATLDYRWFDDYGDWEPRKDTFPDDTIKKVVDEFHKQGILVQLWWQPIAVEDGQGKHALPKPMVTSRLVREHPDWLILDPQGRHARLISPVSTGAALCPALPEVQEYYKKLVERFVRDWGFDGFKMDSVYSVPPCYNPKHHHRSPNDSVDSMWKVYKVIFATLRTLKPQSVTQICPCGTTPNYTWLPFEDQPVTADPVGGVQVRRRIKMYKALLGPQAAVYGDHVELSGMRQVGQEWIESGRDFASTVGTGGVVGTKFTWPGNSARPEFRRVQLTPEKEAHWKKWIDLYNSKMLSRGTFLNLYTLGYDFPEGYAIAKDNKMYYAFFVPDDSRPWFGKIELRGLQPGKYRVFDYVYGRDFGTVDAQNPRLEVAFTANLLLEVSRL
jgi:alpha-galactosidase